MKYKTGDWVKVREDFYKIRFTGDPGVNDRMKEMAGMHFQIKHAFSNCYYLEGDDYQWSWAEKWLENGYESSIKPIEESDIILMLK